MAGVDGSDPVGPERHEHGVELRCDLGRNEAGRDRVRSGREVGTVLFDTSERQHDGRRSPECLRDL